MASEQCNPRFCHKIFVSFRSTTPASITCPQLARNPAKQPGLIFLSRPGCCRSVCEISRPGIAFQRLKKCAIHRQIAANTITASTTIRRRSSNSPRRSLMHVRQSGQGNLNIPIYDRCTSREICMAEIQSEAYVGVARLAECATASYAMRPSEGKSPCCTHVSRNK